MLDEITKNQTKVLVELGSVWNLTSVMIKEETQLGWVSLNGFHVIYLPDDG